MLESARGSVTRRTTVAGDEFDGVELGVDADPHRRDDIDKYGQKQDMRYKQMP